MECIKGSVDTVDTDIRVRLMLYVRDCRPLKRSSVHLSKSLQGTNRITSHSHTMIFFLSAPFNSLIKRHHAKCRAYNISKILTIFNCCFMSFFLFSIQTLGPRKLKCQSMFSGGDPALSWH